MSNEPWNTQLQKLKIRLKTWEHEFSHNQNRKPTKQDVKSNPSISLLYKEYYNLKQKVAGEPDEKSSPRKKNENVEQPEFRTPTKVRKVEKRSFEQGTPTSKPLQVTPKSADKSLLGPTPQLSRRVINIFEDISPDPSPNAKISQTADSSMVSIAETSLQSMTPTTPSKLIRPSIDLSSPSSAIFDTPSTYRTEVPSSPNFLRVSSRCRKSLSEMINELKEIEDDYGNDEERILAEVEENESSSSSEPEENNAQSSLKPFKRRIKRQTRLVKLPPSVSTEKSHLDSMPEIDEEEEATVNAPVEEEEEIPTQSARGSANKEMNSDESKRRLKNGLLLGKQVSENFSSYKLNRGKGKGFRSRR
ncbi:DNA replication checkpoint protein Drc1 [Schizosaccharomyces cryophilus OY26]|uniref:DNA replication regulator SLD2 n=1 Tax=Schizosaccharomyces cryophilus (strain OY26 / ATCC MYA-4695 / CBS 11777 / NBRC 106824 / NRRL Y48691) TaxID=653667 RepID=S9W0F4_SCHCR|nr:DNA replication checkpoint protein Drc1 [Schizosaccharomyces cryophilus OY26]EPY51879.1 DNA replication checkpoint protein Drc1 [Schizosaccharomyces cryophilus OY26]